MKYNLDDSITKYLFGKEERGTFTKVTANVVMKIGSDYEVKYSSGGQREHESSDAL